MPQGHLNFIQRLIVKWTRKPLKKMNLGQDIPFFTGIIAFHRCHIGRRCRNRIHGKYVSGEVMPGRINVTINGVPLNDPESQGIFWVDIPDFATSVDQLFRFREVSVFQPNGAGAFGATINFKTTGIHKKPYGNVSASYGSFNASRLSASIGTGLIGDHFSFDGRLSNISSDGYVNRAVYRYAVLLSFRNLFG